MTDWESVDWEDLTPRLIAYASFELRKYKMDLGRNGSIALGYVERAVVKVVGGHYEPKVARSPFVAIAVVIHEDIKGDAGGR